MKLALLAASSVCLLVGPSIVLAEKWQGLKVFLEDQDGARIEIATLSGGDGRYQVAMKDDVFTNHFLSMRPFKCLDGKDKTWCHVPYPYAIERQISTDFTDLEYDFLFVWKGRSDYGIDMWNGVYYVMEETETGIVGHMHEIDMGILAVPPDPGNMRPIQSTDMEEADPSSHWLPRLVIE